jgi:hypothetical protein
MIEEALIPSKSSQFTNGCSYARQGHAHDHLSKVVARPYKSTADADAQRSKEGNVALAKQILQISSIRTCCSNGKNVGGWKPG